MPKPRSCRATGLAEPIVGPLLHQLAPPLEVVGAPISPLTSQLSIASARRLFTGSVSWQIMT